MGLKELLKNKISTEIQKTPEYKILLNLIKKEKITSVEGLRHQIYAEINKNKECLEECASGSTKNRFRSKEAHNIEFFETIKKKILPRL